MRTVTLLAGEWPTQREVGRFEYWGPLVEQPNGEIAPPGCRFVPTPGVTLPAELVDDLAWLIGQSVSRGQCVGRLAGYDWQA